MLRFLFDARDTADLRTRAAARTPQAIAVVAVAGITALALMGCSAAREFTSSPGRDASAVAPAQSAGGTSSGKATTDSATGNAVAPSEARAVAPAGAPGQPLPTAGDPRRIVRNGTADLEVRSVSDAFESIRQIAAAANGSVADSSFTGSGERQSATMTLRIPVDRFGDVVAKLRDVAVEVRSITTGSSDVTDEYTDIEATLRNLRAVELQYTQLLGRAGSIGDVLQVQDRLNQTRLQIDRTEARRQPLASRSEMSTVTVSLRQVTGAVTGNSPLQLVQRAWQASLTTLTVIGTVLLMIAVYSWWMVPLVVIAVLVVRRQMRRQRDAASST